MRLADQFQTIVAGLPENWPDARFELRVADPGQAERASSLLAPTAPGRSGSVVRFTTARRGVGAGPDAIVRILRRLDTERIGGDLVLLASGEPVAERAATRPTFVAAWDAAVEALPPDWSDLYCEVELHSTDYHDRAALLMAPLNPDRSADVAGFRFRVARNFGYGGSPAMARRCLERLDEASIRGEVRILRALSDTHPVHTQGPVWYVGGKAV